MSYRLIRVFCAAPGNHLAEEVRLFHEAVAKCNAAEGLAAGALFVPLTVSLKLKGQDVVDDNIRTCDYYLLVLDDTWGPPGKSFEHDYRLAQECRKDARLPMREVIVFLKERSGTPLETGLERFRQAVSGGDSPAHHAFRNAAEFHSQVRAALSGWLSESAAA